VWGGRCLTREEILSLLEETKVARFCSLNDDGTIHAAPVWFKYDDGNIFIGTPASSRKARNVRRNKDVSILIDVGAPQIRGVLIYGAAKTTELGSESEVEAMALSICEKYQYVRSICQKKRSRINGVLSVLRRLVG